jgi:hypothetical protein
MKKNGFLGSVPKSPTMMGSCSAKTRAKNSHAWAPLMVAKLNYKTHLFKRLFTFLGRSLHVFLKLFKDLLNKDIFCCCRNSIFYQTMRIWMLISNPI